MTNYKTFDYAYSKDSLLFLYNKLKSDGKTQVDRCFEVADLTDVPHNMFPRMDIFDRTLDLKEYGLAELLSETGYHENPNNNGLIVFPVEGVIGFTFEDGTTVEITEPTITNGRIKHTYFPKTTPAVFFAIKIPLDVTWMI